MSTTPITHTDEADGFHTMSIGASSPVNFHPLSFVYRNENDGARAYAWVETNGVLHLDGMTVEQCAQMFVNAAVANARHEQQMYATSQPIELCSGYTSLFVLRALCGHYPADEQTALFWETVRAMMREDAMFDVPAE